MRRAVAAVGAVAVIAGLFVSYQQGLAGLVPATWAFVLLVAVVAGIQGLAVVASRRVTTLEETETGDPERRYEAPRPGDDIAETLGLARQRSRGRDSPRDRIRARVADTAVAAIVDAEGCAESTARERVRTGEWTEDPVAAWFLGEEVGLPAGQRARLLASAPFSQYEAAFARTIRVVEQYSGGAR